MTSSSPVVKTKALCVAKKKNAEIAPMSGQFPENLRVLTIAPIKFPSQRAMALYNVTQKQVGGTCEDHPEERGPHTGVPQLP